MIAPGTLGLKVEKDSLRICKCYSTCLLVYSYCPGKVSDNSSLRRKRVTLVHSSRTQSFILVISKQQELESSHKDTVHHSGDIKVAGA